VQVFARAQFFAPFFVVSRGDAGKVVQGGIAALH